MNHGALMKVDHLHLKHISILNQLTGVGRLRK
jgi:hypothetical protein